MFDIFAKLLSSVASFLFPLFASYKALKTSDPAQLTPWLMYWVVLACVLLVESWTEWFLAWIPFYAYIRLFFLLYLVLPQTQGARVIYQTHIHPWLEDNETAIEDLIATTHDRLRAAGADYLRRAVDAVRTHLLGQPATAAASPPPTPAAAAAAEQSYTQALLARFSLPSARGAAAAADLYSLLSSAVSGGGGSDDARARAIAAQREKLIGLLSALEREETRLRQDGAAEPSPPGGLGKSRSEGDFVQLEAESGAEEMEGVAAARRRAPGSPPATATAGSWMPWGWGGGSGEEVGKSSGVEQ